MLDVCVEEKRFAGRTPGVEHVALKGLTLSVATGEFACLVGPSGSGKSTLLNIIGGLDRQVCGRVTLDGSADISDVGYMFQTPRLMPWLTVLDNVRLVLDGAPAAERAP